MGGGLAALLMIVGFVLPAPSKTTSVNVESRPYRGGAPDAIAAIAAGVFQPFHSPSATN